MAYDLPLPPPPPPPSPTPTPSPEPRPPKATNKPQPKPEPRPKPKPPAPAASASPAAVALPQPRIVLREPVVAPVASGGGGSEAAGNGEAGQGRGGGGRGAGGGGSGAGGDGAGVIVRRAEKIAGEIRARDFPRIRAAERNGRSTIVRYQVGVDGRVHNCRVTQPSGSAEADAITCRVIEERFRYRPARDAAGRAVPDVTGWRQWWWQ